VVLAGTTLWVGPAAANLPWKLELTSLGQNVRHDRDVGRQICGHVHERAAGKHGCRERAVPLRHLHVGRHGHAPTSYTIHVIRDPGGTDDTSSTSAPTRPTRPGRSAIRMRTILVHSVPVSTSGTDTESGVSSVSVQRSETALTGSTCGASWSAFAPVTLSGGNDTTVADSTCYRYQVVVTDRVGNSSTFGSASVVQIPDVTAPTLLSAATNVAGTQLTLTMSEPLDGTATTQTSAFTVAYDGVVQPTPTGIAVAGSTVTLNLASAPNNSETVTVRYSQPSAAGERMRDTASPTKNETANFGPAAVVNNTPDTVAPSVVSASVNASALTILLTETLAGAAPDPTAFTVTTGSTTRAVTNVSMSGKVVTLTIAPAATSNDSVVVSYSTPALNGLSDASSNAGRHRSTRAVANQTPIVAPPTTGGGGGGGTAPAPALVSSSPDDGSTVRAAATITLTANQAVSWTNMTLTRPNGTVTQLASSSGQSATWALTNATEGLYVVRGTVTADGRSDDVLTHFTVWVPPTTGFELLHAAGAEERRPVRRRRAERPRRQHDARLADRRPSATRSSSRSSRSAPNGVTGLPVGSRVVNVSAFVPQHPRAGPRPGRRRRHPLRERGLRRAPGHVDRREDVARHPAAGDPQTSRRARPTAGSSTPTAPSTCSRRI